VKEETEGEKRTRLIKENFTRLAEDAYRIGILDRIRGSTNLQQDGYRSILIAWMAKADTTYQVMCYSPGCERNSVYEVGVCVETEHSADYINSFNVGDARTRYVKVCVLCKIICVKTIENKNIEKGLPLIQPDQAGWLRHGLTEYTKLPIDMVQTCCSYLNPTDVEFKKHNTEERDRINRLIGFEQNQWVNLWIPGSIWNNPLRRNEFPPALFLTHAAYNPTENSGGICESTWDSDDFERRYLRARINSEYHDKTMPFPVSDDQLANYSLEGGNAEIYNEVYNNRYTKIPRPTSPSYSSSSSSSAATPRDQLVSYPHRIAPGTIRNRVLYTTANHNHKDSGTGYDQIVLLGDDHRPLTESVQLSSSSSSSSAVTVELLVPGGYITCIDCGESFQKALQASCCGSCQFCCDC
jgi:hypothetical protein